MTPLRLALVVDIAPRKLGSFEDWMTRCASAARERGWTVDVFGREPLHEEVSRRLAAAGAGWRSLDALEAAPVRASRALARDYDVLHLNLLAQRSRVALAAYAAMPARVVFVDHFSGALGENAPASGTRRRLARLVDRVTMVRASMVVGVSRYVRDRNRRRFRVPEERLRTIHNGVDVDRFRPAVRSGEPTEVRLLAAANLIPEKGIDHLVRALARLSDLPLRARIVGDGPERDRLERLCEAGGIRDGIEFLGLRHDLEALLRETDIFVHPATWAEASGLTVLEAMASGCAIVATRTGGMPEHIEHERSGLLVPPGDAGALAAAIGVLARSAEKRAALGAAARIRALERFDLASCVRRHLDCCEQVQDATRRSGARAATTTVLESGSAR